MLATELDIRLLGRFSVRRAGREIPPGEFHGRLVRTLLRILIIRAGQLLSRDYLTESLWPGRPPADPERNLNVMIARARRALGDPSLIATGSGGYSFHPAPGCVVDAELFLDSIRAGRSSLHQGRHGSALKDFRTALDLWAGEPLVEDTYEDWAQEYRRNLADAHLEALEGASEAALTVGLVADAAALARTATAREPLREASHLLLGRSLAVAGDTAGALAVLREFRVRLADELGLDSPASISDLEQVLLRGVALVRPTIPQTMASAVPGELAFAGREQEIHTMVAAVGGSGRGLVIISGAPGSGKTRLIHQASRLLHRPVLYARGFSAERDEPWSLAGAVLREALELFPDCLDSLPGRIASAIERAVPGLDTDLRAGLERIDPQSVRALAVQGATRVLGEVVARGAVVVIDDLQWCDPTSLSVLGVAREHIGSMPLVLSYRSNELEGPLLAFVNDQLPRAVGSIELGPLDREDIERFFAEPELGRVVAEQTEGTPLAISELIRTMAAAGTLKPEPGNRWSAGAADALERVRDAAHGGRIRAIVERVDSLPPQACELLEVLALLGRPATARLLASSTSSAEAAVLDNLELLVRNRLVRLGDDGWLPAHDLVGEAVSERLSREERGRLHALLAGVLNDGRADESEVARHLAGAGDKTAAAQAFAGAGQAALDRYASEEAEEFANSGLALCPDPSVTARLLEVRAEARVRRGQIPQARQDLRTALAGKQTGPEKSLVLSSLALLVSGAEDYSQAKELVDLALTEAGSDLPARARGLAVGTMVEGNLGNLEEAGLMADEALELFRRLGDAHGAADVLELQALNLVYAGNLIDGVDLLGRVVNLFRDAGKLLRIGPAVGMHGLVLRAMQRLDEALAELDDAIELEQQLGNPGGESWCRSARSLVLSDLGRASEGRTEAQRSLDIARNLGHLELTSGALLELGYALHKLGKLNEAMSTYEECARGAAGLPAYLSFACSGMGMLEVERGNLDAAEAHLQSALDAGFPFAMYSAQLVQAELLVARSDEQAAGFIAGYLSAAEAQSCWQTIPRLRELLQEATLCRKDTC